MTTGRITTHFDTIAQRVYNWAMVNCPDDVMYGTRYAYWTAALAAGVCSEAEYSLAYHVYDTLWHYRGD